MSVSGVIITVLKWTRKWTVWHDVNSRMNFFKLSFLKRDLILFGLGDGHYSNRSYRLLINSNRSLKNLTLTIKAIRILPKKYFLHIKTVLCYLIVQQIISICKFNNHFNLETKCIIRLNIFCKFKLSSKVKYTF